MRAVLGIVLVAMLSSVATAEDKQADKKIDPKANQAKDDAKSPPPAAPAKPLGPDDTAALALLEKIVREPAGRPAAIEELGKLAPNAIDGLAQWLARPHQASVEDRRAVLAKIDALVPDKKGKFVVPQRKSNKELKADDNLDWQKSLLALDPSTPGVGEVIADVAAIRALASAQDIRATKPIFDTAFAEETMIYRDECGRYMRKMEPYSIPYLTRESQTRNWDRRRYATYQLERLDRQDAAKALDAAIGNEALQIAILDVFRETKLREAVGAVWKKVDDDAPRVRDAARKTWMEYITGPAPPPAPKKKLQLPGGKLTKKPKPLWLTYRELADGELRRAANALLHEDYEIAEDSLDDKERHKEIEKIDLLEVTKRLFAYYDGERAKKESAQYGEAKAKADAGDLVAAGTMLDRLIATNPERAERAEMAKIYVALGKLHESNKQWSEASGAYSKAHGLDPKGPNANQTLAAHHYTLGKALEAAGKDGGPDFRRAMALEPNYSPAKSAAAVAEERERGKPVWMIYAAIVAALIAMAFLALGIVKRRHA